MSTPSPSTRDRLIQAALELFVSQGISNTTTRQIANLAEVNEVTLFRHFGNKHGLLLAVIEESPTFANLEKSLLQGFEPSESGKLSLKEYASYNLHSLEQMPELFRSLIGEADQYPDENRQAIGKRLAEVNRSIVNYFAVALPQSQIPHDRLSSLWIGALIGYAAIAFTSEFQELWRDREDFLDSLVELFASVTLSESSVIGDRDKAIAPKILDLPTTLVHNILQQAKKSSLQDSAIAYLLFGAGLSPREIASLEKSQQICDKNQHILQVTVANRLRQVPVNQWILGKRYGSYTNNPLTKWLKSRKDKALSLFLTEESQPISALEIQKRWQIWLEGLTEGEIPAIARAQQTWCVEMLMRGMSLENLSILTGLELVQLQTYARRAKEKAAIEEATLLDRKP
ncbi:TetR family transcriptional regulator [Spirulina sp. 06S082]|uniref:TetR family transcriptional regulator n=1 Tax=Spirulina sp. 06S082 TaxID=3110248 RepID=UPI002B20FDF0|nr:TetR family transcriptional regulator [Spirulina sp. 06S082]MEA5469223.1 TetR family transcriptional regulator [Spirulina sp. 06S082]